MHAGVLTGPYTISCQPKTGEKIYWQVVHEKVNGTTDATQASKFYIKYLQKDPPKLCIIYVSSMTVDFFVTFVERPDESRLKVVETALLPDVSFQLENSVQKTVDLPENQAELAKQGPFFIRKFGGEGRLARISQAVGYTKPPYIGMVECQDNQYKAMGCEKIDKENMTMRFTIEYERTAFTSSMTASTTSQSMARGSSLTLTPLHREQPTPTSSFWGGMAEMWRQALDYLLNWIQRRKQMDTMFQTMVGTREYSFPTLVRATTVKRGPCTDSQHE